MTDETKTCTKCGRTLPLTTEYFHKAKRGKYGYSSICKPCKKEQRAVNKERIAEQRKIYLEANKEKTAETRRAYREKNKEEIKEWRKGYLEENKEKTAETTRIYREKNKEKIAEQSRKHLEENREEINRKHREKRTKNKEQYAAIGKRWRDKNRDKLRIKDARREARKRALPAIFTHDEWIHSLECFNHCCAACGRQLHDLFGDVKPHADHWIPFASEDCPGTVASNMIPLCNTCNMSKGAKPAEEWLIQKFGKHEAKKILQRIEAYFKSLD